jgi:hypothetical protein
MVILSFCVWKLETLFGNLGNYSGMAVNYQGILTLEKLGYNYCSNLPQYCFITLAPGVNVIKLFTVVIYEFS